MGLTQRDTPMRPVFRSIFLCTLALNLAAPLMAHGFTAGSLKIDHPWTRETTKGQVVGGGFLTIVNEGKVDDLLVSATTPGAAEVQLHTVTMNNGVMQMRRVKGGIAIPARQVVKLEPGAMHIMFMGLKAPLARGKMLPVALRFRRAGIVKVQFAIQPVDSSGLNEAGHAGR